ncbi:MAG: DUF1538 domain-containing protein [Gammaproteobacteria bacterium]|nr:DUF1538 domain-containing protein [Gammaproteobacteria bacterium]
MQFIQDFPGLLFETFFDILPIALIIFGFQFLVIRKRVKDLKKVLIGMLYVLIGITFFLLGLEQALFPIGRSMAEQLTDPEFLQTVRITVGELQWQDYYWVYIFAFAIGAGTTIAEPALIAVAMKANEVSGGAIGVWGLRIAVAIGVAFGLALGSYRIVVGVPMHYFIITGYVIVVIQTFFSPKLIVPLAYDSGGVTTSTVTVPLVAALGLGLAETVPGRSPLIDGFGLIAFASLCPIISVMAYAQLSEFKDKRATKKIAEQDAFYAVNAGKKNSDE